MYRRIGPLTLLLLIPILVIAGCQKSAVRKPASPNPVKPPAAANLMEAAGRDSYENGCVSCHKKTADVDRSLSAYVRRISGHPEVKETSVNACYACHEAQKNYDLYKRFFRGIHKTHWGSGLFYTKMKGQCFSCHTVETNGVSGIKGYPLAGYRSGTAAEKPVEPKSVPGPAPEPKKLTPPKTVQPTKPAKQRSEQAQPKTSQTPEELPTPTP
ncbi:MAG: hypothetical protein ACYC21_01855 [Eubacteriales bacterium]